MYVCMYPIFFFFNNCRLTNIYNLNRKSFILTIKNTGLLGINPWYMNILFCNRRWEVDYLFLHCMGFLKGYRHSLLLPTLGGCLLGWHVF